MHLAAAEETVERVPGDEPPIEERGKPLAEAGFAELGEDKGHVGVLERKRPAHAEGAVERAFDEPRSFRFVRELEAGIDAGLERELVQQR